MASEPDGGKQRSGARLGLLGTVVLAWTLFDGIILGIPIILLAAGLDVFLVVFVAGAVVWSLLNLAACHWLDRQWDTWIVGTRFGNKLESLRDTNRAKRAVDLIARGSAVWFGIAAVLTSACQVIALNRLATGQRPKRSQDLAAALSPAVFWSALFAFVGYVVREAL